MDDSENRIKVVVIDDHPFFRDGVSRGLTNSGRIIVVGEAENGRDGLAMIAREQPDVAVVDYQMPDLDGIALTRAIAGRGLGTRVLLLSAVTDSKVVFQALEMGAEGYLSKDAKRAEIVDAVLAVANGRTVVPAELAGLLAQEIRLRSDSRTPALTERETQVLQGFAAGKSVPQIARELFLGASTIKSHTQRLYEKLGVSDRAAAVAEAMRRGLVE